MGVLNSDLPYIDLRVALDGILRRWWIVVGCVIASLVAVLIQDSGLGSASSSRVMVNRIYEAVIETDELAIVRVDPSAITPIPSFDNQLSIVRSEETASEIRSATGLDGLVEITRSEPRFTITDTVDEQNNRVSFLATGTPSYTFTCVGQEEDSCKKLIDAYVEKTISLRRESVVGGLKGGLALTESLINSANSRLGSIGSRSEEQTALQGELASLLTKRDALRQSISMVTGSLILISTDSRIVGQPTSSISASSYGFGIGIGLILGVFLALQLAATDKSLRNAWQVRRIDEDLRLIGSPFASSSDSQATALAAALQDAQQHGADSALIFAEHPALRDLAHGVMSRISSLPTTLIESVSSVTVDQLAPSNTQVAIVLIKAGHTTRHQLAESIGLVTAGGSHLLGVALID